MTQEELKTVRAALEPPADTLPRPLAEGWKETDAKLIEGFKKALAEMPAGGGLLIDHEEAPGLVAFLERAQAALSHHIAGDDPREAVVAALKKATYELNAIRARDGAPQHIDWYQGRPLQTDACTHEYWDALTEECFAALRLAGVNDIV